MELLVLNTSFQSIKIIDNFKSLIWTDRYNSYGDFELCLPVDSEVLMDLKENNYLWLKESEHLMIIEDISITSDIEDGSSLVVTGRSLESILDRRIVWGQKIISGSLQDAIQTVLTEAIVSPTNTDRAIPNFIFEASTDSRITALTVSETQLFGEDLYTVIGSLCVLNRLGFKVVLNDSNQFVFSLYFGTDRSYDQTLNPYVIFSPNFENIINSNYFRSNANLKNVTYIAGEGEGASRKTATVGSGTGLARRELFTDARDISSDTDSGTLTDAEYTSQMESRGTENLADYTVNTAFDGEVEATKLFKYGEDFFIGDIVQIANEYGNEGRSYISELVISQSEEGQSMYPTFETIQEEGDIA